MVGYSEQRALQVEYIFYIRIRSLRNLLDSIEVKIENFTTKNFVGMLIVLDLY